MPSYNTETAGPLIEEYKRASIRNSEAVTMLHATMEVCSRIGQYDEVEIERLTTEMDAANDEMQAIKARLEEHRTD